MHLAFLQSARWMSHLLLAIMLVATIALAAACCSEQTAAASTFMPQQTPCE